MNTYMATMVTANIAAATMRYTVVEPAHHRIGKDENIRGKAAVPAGVLVSERRPVAFETSVHRIVEVVGGRVGIRGEDDERCDRDSERR